MPRWTRNWKPTTLNVVLDASSLIGALLREDSVPERALLSILNAHRLLLSEAVATEYLGVTSRPRFARRIDAPRWHDIWTTMQGSARFVTPDMEIADCRDAKDNKHLELALAGAADVIVSSDRDLLDLDPWRGIRIVTPAEFLVLAREP